MKIGVYICNCGTNISGVVNMEAIQSTAVKLPWVSYCKSFGLLCSGDGKKFLEEDLKKEKPDRVVVAACTPRDHEATFRQVLIKAGINPYLMQMVNIREHVSWVTADKEEATEKALAVIRGAVARVKLHEPLEVRTIDMNPDVLVIGSGPAGLKAAITAAEAGRKVVLVEKLPVIGGMPVRYEEVFPSMECGPCMLEPVLGEVLHGKLSKQIEILTLAEVTDVSGFYGNFITKVHKKPRRVDVHSCIGCGECVTACPVSAKNMLDCGMKDKKAIDFVFTNALPNVPFIDDSLCLRSKGQACDACAKACPLGPQTIIYEETETIIERHVGAIVVATGAELYDCIALPSLGYATTNDVYTSLEFERLLASNGPTAGKVQTSKNTPPASVALIHCVGSLDKKHKEYCSGICCQYALKINHILHSKFPGITVTHFYKEMVVPGKENHRLYAEERENKNTSFIRYSDIADLKVTNVSGQNKVLCRLPDRKVQEISADMVILCPAVVPAQDAVLVAGIVDITRDKFGFFEELHGRMDSSKSTVKGIFIAGACQSPKDIAQAVSHGCASAGSVLAGLVPGKKLEIDPATAAVNPDICSGCRTCVTVCPYKAISIDAATGKSVVNAVLCQGCGSCASACPSGAIKANHFTFEEIIAEIDGVLGE